MWCALSVALGLLTMESLGNLSSFQPTTKDVKCLLPTLITVFEEFSSKLNTLLQDLREEFINLLKESDEKVLKLQNEVGALQKRIRVLEEKMDESDAYERKDTLIFSGSKLPISKLVRILKL